jgi:hypothetical protein
MCWGKDDPPEMQAIPNPPPEKEMMDFVSYITGTQSVTVTDADGKKRRITTRLPRTAEDQEALQTGQDLLITSMQDIQDLYKYDPRSVINFAPLVNTFANLDQQRIHDLGQIANLGTIEQDKIAFKDMQRTIIDEQFDLQRQSDEERLAHTGRGAGTYAAESRAAMARARGLAHMEGAAKATGYAEDLAAKRLGTNKEAFGLREAGRQGTLESVRADYSLNKADEQDQEARRQQALAERKGQFDIGSNVIRYDDWKALQDKTHDQSLNTYLAENNVQNQRYGQQVGAIQANNRMTQEAYANKPPSFGEWAANTGARLGAAYFTGGMSEGGRMMMPSTEGAYGPRVGRETIGRMF